MEQQRAGPVEEVKEACGGGGGGKERGDKPVEGWVGSQGALGPGLSLYGIPSVIRNLREGFESVTG